MPGSEPSAAGFTVETLYPREPDLGYRAGNRAELADHQLKVHLDAAPGALLLRLVPGAR